MKIVIIFPKKFFTQEQLNLLSKHQTEFINGNNIDLNKIDILFNSKDLILAVDPTYLKESWDALPIERIQKMRGLKALCLTTTSYSWVDIKKINEMGIVVTYIPGKSTNAVAEFNIYMMFSLLRKTPLIVKNNWKMDYNNFLSNEARGLTAGIIGLGQIGIRVAELCKGLGMNVCYWNRSIKQVEYKKLELTELLKTSDVLFNTVAVAPEIKGMITGEMIESMKNTALLISTSPPIYDHNFIIKQTAENKLGGYAFESNEEKVADFKGNIMVFPEQAYYTFETTQSTARILTDTIFSIIKGGPINKVG